MDSLQRWYRRTILTWAVVILSAAAHAQAVFVVTEPWVRPGEARQSTEAFMTLMSSADATLIAARSELAARVSLRAANGKTVLNMTLPLPANDTVALEPRGQRLVLHQPSRRLRSGDRVPMVLTLRHADGSVRDIAVDAEVRRRSPTDDHRRPHVHH